MLTVMDVDRPRVLTQDTLNHPLIQRAAAVAAGWQLRDVSQPPSTLLNIWGCMVCGAQNRPYAAISVVQQPLVGFEDVEGAGVNVAYCNDRAECAAVATPRRPWTVAGPAGENSSVATYKAIP
jgi:hypothetical protein